MRRSLPLSLPAKLPGDDSGATTRHVAPFEALLDTPGLRSRLFIFSFGGESDDRWLVDSRTSFASFLHSNWNSYSFSAIFTKKNHTEQSVHSYTLWNETKMREVHRGLWLTCEHEGEGRCSRSQVARCAIEHIRAINAAATSFYVPLPSVFALGSFWPAASCANLFRTCLVTREYTETDTLREKKTSKLWKEGESSSKNVSHGSALV